MRILVTGGAGFIGSNLIKRLVKENHEVWSIDNYDSGTKNNHVKGAIFHNEDICNKGLWNNYSSWLNQLSFDMCFHLAALPRIQPSFDNPVNTYKVNTDATLNVIEWAKRSNIKVIYAGSSSRWHDPYQSPYACFKHMGEEIFKLYRKVYNCNFEIVRFYNVYGPGEIIDGDWAAVTGIWRRQIRDGKPITIVGDGEQRRDFTHVEDIVDGLYKIAMSDKNHPDAWELGTGVNYSINELYAMFKKRFNVECVHLPDQPGNYRETLQEHDDANIKLGWSPTDQLEKYINNLK